MNTENRKKWQDLIQKDLINPSQQQGNPIGCGATTISSNYGNQEVQDVRSTINTVSHTPAGNSAMFRISKFPSFAEKRMDEVRKKYNKYALQKQQLDKGHFSTGTEIQGYNGQRGFTPL